MKDLSKASIGITLLFCLINARNLFYIPLISQIIFFVWLIPIIIFYFTHNPPKKDQTYLFVAALLMSFLGWIIELQILKNFAFALALVALIPWTIFSPLWWALSALWIPSFGWFFSGTLLEDPYHKILVASVATILALFYGAKNE